MAKGKSSGGDVIVGIGENDLIGDNDVIIARGIGDPTIDDPTQATVNGTNGNDILVGTADDDVIIARGGADLITAGGGNDVITIRTSPGGSDTIHGGAGSDTVVVDADYSTFTVSEAGGSIVFTSSVTGFSETADGVEQFAFDDQTVLIVGAGGYASIQAAVDAAPSGAIILVAGGVYTEQLHVDGKTGLTIMAIPGSNVTIHAPADVGVTGLSSSGRDINAVVTVTNSSDIVFSHITVDGGGVGNTIDEGAGPGQANFVGVFYRNSSGGLDTVNITGVRNPYEAGLTVGGHPIVSGVQTGVGLQVDNDANLAFFMHHGSIADFQKNASVINHAILDIDGVTVTGGGAQPINAQNGFQVLNSTGTIANSTITGIGYAGPADAYSGGILAYGNTDLNITANTIVGANAESAGARIVGIYIFDNGPDNSGGSVTGNHISYVDEGIDVSGGLGPNSIVIADNDVTNIDLTDPYHAGIYFAPDGSTNDTVSGTGGDDYLYGGGGTDTLSGLGGNDTLDGGTGNDTLNGGLGTDSALYAGAISGYSYVTNFDANGMATGFTSVTQTSSGDVDALSSIERLQFGDTTLDVTAPVQLRDSGGQLVGTFSTIQAAINAAGNGATILITQDGTYTEQLTINGKTGLTIAALPGANVSITAPASIAINGHTDYFSDDVRAVIAVTNSTNVNIRGVTVDGHFSGDTTPGSNGDELTGIAYLNSTGSVDHVNITHVGNSTTGGLFGLQHGSGLLIDNSNPSGNDAVSVTNSTISGFQKTGALIVGADITFTGNTITGVGATGLTAQNGIQIAHSHGTLGGNSISGIGYTVPVGGTYYYSAGIIAYEPNGALAMDGNSITGVGGAGEFTALDLSDTAGIGVSFQNNVISNSTNGIVAYTYTGGGLGLDANPNFTGTTFSGITGEGIHFDPEETYGSPFSTGTAFNVTGTAFHDTLAGSDGNDTFTAGDGDDLVEGRGGNDVLNGGIGTDSAKYEGSSAGYSYTVTTNAQGFITGFTSVTHIASGDVDTLSSIEKLVFDNVTFSVADGVQLFNGTGDFIGSYATIQAAVDAASDGFTIRVGAGTYAEDVNVSKAVTIYGAHHGDTATGAGRDAAAGAGETTIIGNWRITATNSVTIDGLRFVNDATTTGGPSNAPLWVLTGGGHSITNNIFWSTIVGAANDDRAIQVSPIASGSVSITDNLISGTQQGLFGTASWARGIWADGGGVTVTIDGNTTSWTRSALNLDNSGGSHFTVSDNSFTNAGTGIAVGFTEDGITFSNNDFRNVGDDFNFRNLTDDVTFDASTAIHAVTPATPANPVQDSVVILGGSGNDTLTGTDGNDIIDGNNLVLGHSDNDVLTGGLGNDLLYGRAGTDTARYLETVGVGAIAAVADADPFTAGNQAGWTVTTPGGTDTLVGIEIISHAGGKILLVGNGGFASIQAAVNAASDGDTILVGAGIYSEDVVVNKGVTILGAHHGDAATAGGRDAAAGAGETTIIGNWQITASTAVTVDGLRFVNDATTTGGPSNALVWILTGAGHQVTNSIFWSTIVGAANDDRAIQISPIASGSVSITDNLISGTQQGLFGTASWARGIWADGGGVTVTIDGNTTSWTRSALNLDNSGGSHFTVSDNSFTNAGTGIAVGFTEDGITFSNNDFRNVGDDFNFRNLTDDVTFDASTAIHAVTPVSPANPVQDSVVILGGSGNDTLTGTDGNDIIDGNNLVFGHSDNDVLTGGLGNDLLYGRAGTDTARYLETVGVGAITAVADADPFTAGNQAGWTVTLPGGTDTLVGIEIISHAGGKILLVGNGGFSSIQAAINAASDGDTILVAAGSYSEDVVVNKGVTILGAHHGDDGTAGGRDASGGTGETTIIGNWQVTASANVTIDGLRFINDGTTTGGAGNPVLWVLSGGTTGHTITNSIFWSTISGAANGDRAIQVSPIATGAVSITHNLISGTQQAMFGTASWDRGVWSDGGGIAVTVDRNTFSWTRTAINVDMAGATTAMISHNNLTNSGSGLSIGTDTDGLTLIDNNSSNVGTEFNFRNLTSGFTFDAGAAIDALTTGFAANDSIVILGGSGSDTITGTEFDDYIDGNNHPTLGSAADNDNLYGGDGNDTIFGRAGNDLLEGGAGNDTLDGGAGLNILRGGAGNDRLIVGAGADGTTADGGADTDTLVVTGPAALAGVSGIEALEFQAGGALTITGSQAINGLAANTALSGTGSLTINMNAGVNELYVNQFVTTGGSSVTVTINGSGDNDVIKGVQGSVNILNGGGGSDSMRGGAQRDILNGGDGDDKIEGAGGADILTGGAGADQFRYQSQNASGVGAAADQITDFVIGQDRLGFGLLDPDPITPGDQSFSFIGTGAFHATGAAEIRYADFGANIIVQADVNGDGVVDMEIILQGIGGQTLSATDFIL